LRLDPLARLDPLDVEPLEEPDVDRLPVDRLAVDRFAAPDPLALAPLLLRLLEEDARPRERELPPLLDVSELPPLLDVSRRGASLSFSTAIFPPYRDRACPLPHYGLKL
jgi:hypothetical protein